MNNLPKYAYVCSKHFSTENLIRGSKRTTLSKYAVPRISEFERPELKRSSSTETASSRTVTIPDTDNQSLLSSPKKFLIKRVIESLPESREYAFKNSFSTETASSASSRTLTADIVFGSFESSPEEHAASLTEKAAPSTEKCTAGGLKRKFEALVDEENFPSVITPSSPGISNITLKKRKLNMPRFFGDIEYEDLEDPNRRKICWNIITNTVNKLKI
ncbi:uncharacterized protein LOC123670876 isoform X2 [Harmonia axyridis]|uniref:uncharacterized protein LOC123670876 isoform X2 n=1 Tax=Harmonia axyridis TaxID=115357 RepID=UPI001E277BC6|nr:uncharacterized protein LOC123670876 isoform X2 [Harmonia axyridis]